MNQTNTSTPVWVGKLTYALEWAKRYSFELAIVGIILYICLSRGVSFQVNVHDPHSSIGWSTQLPARQAGLLPDLSRIVSIFGTSRSESVFEIEDCGTSAGTDIAQSIDLSASGSGHRHIPVRNVSLLHSASPRTSAIASPVSMGEGSDHFNSVALTDDPAPHISNLTLVLSPTYFERHGISPAIKAAKRQRLQHYIATYAPLAQTEMRDHGIPASITLAQGLLESNAGDSRLARQSNNHFGIKCKSRCLGCTCRNYGDDTRYDMFRVFESVSESFEEHSALLQLSRYARLFTYGTDYKRWAHGLKACGYATDPNYGKKLIKIIEELQLHRFDV